MRDPDPIEPPAADGRPSRRLSRRLARPVPRLWWPETFWSVMAGWLATLPLAALTWWLAPPGVFGFVEPVRSQTLWTILGGYASAAAMGGYVCRRHAGRDAGRLPFALSLLPALLFRAAAPPVAGRGGMGLPTYAEQGHWYGLGILVVVAAGYSSCVLHDAAWKRTPGTDR